ncbi:MAG: hypothetical protein MHM6MM_000196 [Cercozoa sp. M6MM]
MNTRNTMRAIVQQHMPQLHQLQLQQQQQQQHMTPMPQMFCRSSDIEYSNWRDDSDDPEQLTVRRARKRRRHSHFVDDDDSDDNSDLNSASSVSHHARGQRTRERPSRAVLNRKCPFTPGSKTTALRKRIDQCHQESSSLGLLLGTSHQDRKDLARRLAKTQRCVNEVHAAQKAIVMDYVLNHEDLTEQRRDDRRYIARLYKLSQREVDSLWRRQKERKLAEFSVKQFGTSMSEVCGALLRLRKTAMSDADVAGFRAMLRRSCGTAALMKSQLHTEGASSSDDSADLDRGLSRSPCVSEVSLSERELALSPAPSFASTSNCSVPPPSVATCEHAPSSTERQQQHMSPMTLPRPMQTTPGQVRFPIMAVPVSVPMHLLYVPTSSVSLQARASFLKQPSASFLHQQQQQQQQRSDHVCYSG